MSTTKKAVNVVTGDGSSGAFGTQRIVGELTNVMGQGDSLAAFGFADHNPQTTSELIVPNLPLDRLIAMTAAPTSEGYGYLADRQRSAERAEARLPIALSLNSRIIERVRAQGLDSIFTVSVGSPYPCGHYDAHVERLRDYKARLPRALSAAVYFLPHEPNLQDAVRNNPN